MSDATPETTGDGRVVLYRQPGDVWQVARDQEDIRFLTGLTRAERAARGLDVVLVPLPERTQGTGCA